MGPAAHAPLLPFAIPAGTASIGWEADLSTQARVKAVCEFTTQPKLGSGRGALERRPRKQALTIGRGAGTSSEAKSGFPMLLSG